MKHHFIAQPKFWSSYRKLSDPQRKAVAAAWRLFKIDPFDPRLRTHRVIHLSSVFRRPISAIVIEGALRAVFYLDGDTLVLFNLGDHDIYKG